MPSPLLQVRVSLRPSLLTQPTAGGQGTLRYLTAPCISVMFSRFSPPQFPPGASSIHCRMRWLCLKTQQLLHTGTNGAWGRDWSPGPDTGHVHPSLAALGQAGFPPAPNTAGYRGFCGAFNRVLLHFAPSKGSVPRDSRFCLSLFETPDGDQMISARPRSGFWL